MLMDYPNGRPLKINALAEFRELKDEADLARRLASLGYKATSSTRSGSGLNCPQHITPCSREPELAQALDPVRYRILDLEGEMRAFRAASSNPVSAASTEDEVWDCDISAPIGAQPMTCCYRLHDQET